MRIVLCLVTVAMMGAGLAGCTAGSRGTGAAGAAPHMIFPAEDWVEASPESQGVDAALLEKAMKVLERLCEDDKDGTPTTGITRTVVVRNGRLIWKGSDIDTVQPVFSCTKSFTSSVFGLLVDDGKCTPATLASDVYPALKEHYPKATLGHFANLTSGYSIPWREPWSTIRPSDFAPGTCIHYNGAGHMLSYLFSRLAGEPVPDLWRRRIAEPIGMPDGSWKWNEVGEIDGTVVYGGASGMAISARQMARFGLLYLNKGRWAGRQVFSENWVEESTVPQVPPHTPCFEGADTWYNVLPGRYGYNWWTNGIGIDGQRFWPNAPDATFFAQGNRNNHCIIVPEWNLVLVHLDRGKAISSRLYDKVFAVLSEAVRDGTESQ